MLLALPVCGFGLIAWNLALLRERLGGAPARREVFVLSAVVWGTLLVTLTEVLGAFRALRPFPLAAAWGTACAALAVGGTLLSRVRPAQGARRPSLSRPPLPPLAGVAVILILTGATAVLAPPNTWDSMTYHMARVAHWGQNASVAHYPTSILRQLHLGPGAELFILNFQILSGGDRFANLVQWSALGGCVIAASLIAKLLGADAAGQAMAGFLIATLPTAVLQASSTQNDLTAAFWLLAFVFFLVSWKERPDVWRGAAAGAALGLAVLTKMTALLVATPFLLVFLPSRRVPATLAVPGRRRAASLAAAGALLLGLNLGHSLRNAALFGEPLVIRSDNNDVVVRAMSPSLFLSNAVRSAAMHLGIPFSRSANRWLEARVVSLHRTLGVDPGDPRTSFQGKSFSQPAFSRNEDLAGNPLHLVLAALATALCLVKQDLRRGPLPGGYLAAALTASLLFPLLLNWQPWLARLHLPLFAAWCPLVAIALGSAVPPALSEAVLVALLAGALPAALQNVSRPLMGRPGILSSERASDYFRNSPEREATYREAARVLQARGCRDVGVLLGSNDWEYPLFALAEKGTRFEHVGVTNISARAVSGSFTPCAVVSTVGETPQGFEVVWSGGGVRLLSPR